MDSFFGIGLFELVMIAVVALLVLGPERLPGAMREVAKWIRQLRSLSSELQSQFSDEFKMLDELDPRRMINEALDPNAPSAKAKPAPAQPVKTAPVQPAARPPAPKPPIPAPKPAAAAAPAAGVVIDGEAQNTILPPAAVAATVAAQTPAQAPAEQAPVEPPPVSLATPLAADVDSPSPTPAADSPSPEAAQ